MGRHIDKAIKDQSIKMVEEAVLKIAKVAKEVGISPATLHRWLKEYRTTESNGLTVSEKAELKKLRQENKILKLEKDLLKKATVYFAKHSE